MEIAISDEDSRVLGLYSPAKERIVGLVHTHLGLASVASVTLMESPEGVQIETAHGQIVVNRALTKRID